MWGSWRSRDSHYQERGEQFSLGPGRIVSAASNSHRSFDDAVIRKDIRDVHCNGLAFYSLNVTVENAVQGCRDFRSWLAHPFIADLEAG